MTNLNELDWAKLGRELRRNSLDAHQEVVDVEMAYGFLLYNPDCFLGDNASWPLGMPQEPNIELIAAYYRQDDTQDDTQDRDGLLERLHDAVSGMDDEHLAKLVEAAESYIQG